MSTLTLPLMGFQNSFITTVIAEIRESFRAKWFFLYTLIFGGAIVMLLALGITESQVLGFTGLSTTDYLHSTLRRDSTCIYSNHHSPDGSG